MQLKPKYPSPKEVMKRSIAFQHKKAHERELRKQMVFETEPRDLSLTFEEYRELLDGQSYALIWEAQQLGTEESRITQEQALFEKLRHLYQHIEMLTEMKHLQPCGRTMMQMYLELQDLCYKWEQLCEVCEESNCVP